MKNVHIYISQCIELALSLNIKSEKIAQAMNLPLVTAGYSVSTNPADWRYYKHLYGEYFTHTSATLSDSNVELESLDTHKTIILTKEALKSHKKTATVYKSQPDYVEALVDKYPTMELFIKGVFNPITPTDAIAAEEGEILAYNKDLVETQESNLLTELKYWIQSLSKRFYMQDWESQEAFVAAYWSQVYPQIPAAIMRLRLRNAHTQQVHSFHVEMFLASHQGLDKYIPYMTTEQKMWLYRNIRYIERHPGRRSVLQRLVDIFFTGWDMPVVAYRLGQLVPSDDDVRPEPTVVVEKINFTDSVDGRDTDNIETLTLLQKELNKGSENSDYIDEYEEDLDSKLALTQYPDQPTKVLEVTAIDPKNSNRYRLVKTLTFEWAHCAAEGIYSTTHELLNPLNGDTLRLTTKELYLFYIYGIYRGWGGISLEAISEIPAISVLRKRWIEEDEYNHFLPVSWSGRWDNLIDFYQATHYEIIGSILTADEFYTTASTILEHKLLRYQYGCSAIRTKSRAAARACFKYNYIDVQCDFGIEETTFAKFFERFGFLYTELSDDAWQDIAIDAFQTATALDRNSDVTQKEIQDAMVSLVESLVSYTVHFASTIATEPPIVTDPLMVTPDDIELSDSMSINVVVPNSGVANAELSDVSYTPNQLTKVVAECDEIEIVPEFRVRIPFGVVATYEVITESDAYMPVGVDYEEIE